VQVIYGLGGGTFCGKSLPGLAAKGGFGVGNIAGNVMNYLVGLQEEDQLVFQEKEY
jgi:hypothetical protein